MYLLRCAHSVRFPAGARFEEEPNPTVTAKVERPRFTFKQREAGSFATQGVAAASVDERVRAPTFWTGLVLVLPCAN